MEIDKKTLRVTNKLLVYLVAVIRPALYFFNTSLKYLKSKYKSNRRAVLKGFKIVAVIVLLLVIGSVYYISTRPNYTITASAQKLIGMPDEALAKSGLTYSKKDQSYTLNSKLIGNNIQNNVVRVGGGSQLTYSFKAPIELNKNAITYYDDYNNLSFSLKPNFKTSTTKYANGRFVYPISHNAQLVYSIKANGLKEDIILYKNIGDKLNYSYSLNVPSSLSPKMLPTGDIGLYSVNPILFRNISSSSSSDKQILQKARQNNPKDYLEFIIAMPNVVSSGHSHVSAYFSLKNNQITLHLSNLAKASYPLAIDPSVVVTSANPFSQGNNDSNANITSTSVSTNYITGGFIGSWTASQSITNSREGMATVANNGYIYILGGVNGSTYYNDVQYAPICTGSNTTTGFSTNCSGSSTAGSIGSYNTSGVTFTNTRGFASAVVYNGYIYLLGGVNGSTYYNDVQYAPICTGSNVTTGLSTNCSGSSIPGSIGSFTTASTTLSSSMADFAAVAYNGRIYTIGGQTSGGPINSIYYATFNASTASSTTILGSFTSTGQTVYANVAGCAATAYNNNLYVAGGYNGTTDVATVNYYPISPTDGSLSSGITATSLLTAQDNMSLVAYSGYLYAWGGWTGGISGTTPISSNYMTYTQINANGSLPAAGTDAAVDGSWATSNSSSPFSQNASTANIVYNGYLYSIGGYTGSAYSVATYFAPITSVGNDANFTGGGNFATPLYLPSVVVYDGHIYVMGGCYLSSATKICDGSSGENYNIYFATITNSGTIGTWTLSGQNTIRTVFGAAAVGYRNSLYMFGGCTGTGGHNYVFCNSTNGGYTVISVNTAATGTTDPLSAATSKSDTNAYANVAASAVVSGNYIFLIGGCKPDSLAQANALCSKSGTNAALTNCEYFEFTAGNDQTFTAPGIEGSCKSLTTPIFGASAVAYNGYIYLVGGCPGNSASDALTNPCGTAAWNNIYYISASNLAAGTGSWSTTTNTFTTARLFNGAYAYNGYLYIYGGCSSWNGTYGTCATIQTDIQHAPIKSNGDLGTFSSVSQSVPSGSKAWGTGNANYNGVIYLSGGCTASSNSGTNAGCPSGNFSNYTNMVSLNLGGNSVVGAWANSSTPYTGTSARSYASTVKYTVNNTTYMYMVGGKKSTSDTTCTNGGTSTYDCNDILEYKLSANGAATLQNTYYFVNGRYDAEVAAYNGHLYIIGGQSSSANSTCSLNKYFGNSASSAPAAGQSTSSLNRYVPATYYSCDDVQIATINTNGTLSQPGYLSSYSTNTVGYATTMVNGNPFEYGLAFGSNNADNMMLGTHAYAYGGYLYASGSVWYVSYYDDITSVKINSDGTLATSASATGYQAYASTCQGYDNWLASNGHGCGAYYAGYFGNQDGDLGNELTLYNGYLYIGKGWSPNNTSSSYWTGTSYPVYYPNIANDFLEYTKLGPGGAIGSYTDLGTTTEATWPTNYSLVAYNGYLYVVGGNGNAGNFDLDQPGSPGSYCNFTSTTNSYTACNTILSAAINYGGGLGSFSVVGSTNTSVNNGQMQNIAALIYNGALIMSNGMGESSGILSFANPDTNISYAPLSIIDKSANYSYQLNYLQDISPSETMIMANNTSADTSQYTSIGNINVNYRFAQNPSDSCVTTPPTGTSVFNAASNYYGMRSNIPYPTLAGNDGCSTPNAQTYAQYEFVEVNIDDSGIFTFPDDASNIGATTTNHTNLTNISGYFHSKPGLRLRLGQTFVNQAPTSLDASP